MMFSVGSVYAGDGDGSQADILTALNENIQIVEQYIADQGTSTSEVLRNEKQYLESLRSDTDTVEQTERLEKLIDDYSKQISQYEQYKTNKESISMFGAWHPVYSPAVASISAYFVMQEYRLSAELLMHAESTTDSRTFTPYWGEIARQTGEFTNRVNAMRPNTSGSGSSGFTSKNSTAEADMYYAIHLYNYTYNWSSNRVLVINDTYNFEPSIYDNVAGAAVNTMWLAQQYGTITAYPVQIAIYC